MRLRVITATRGVSPHLDTTVRSVAELGIAVRHIVVAPECMVAQLAARYPHLEVVGEKQGGLYPALNSALELPWNEEAFTWINDDDTVLGGGLRVLLERMELNSAIDIAYGRVQLIDAKGSAMGEIPVSHSPKDLLMLIEAGVMPLAQPGTVLRKRVWERIGPFDASFRLAGDLDYFVRSLKAGVKCLYVDSLVAQFRLHHVQLSKDEAAVDHEYSRVVGRHRRIGARMARCRFCWENRLVYYDRIRRHGLVSMRTLYRHA